MIRKTSVTTVLLLATVFLALGWLLPRGAAVASQGQTARIEELETRLTSLEAAAAAPSVVAYQGYLTDAGGAPLEGTHTLRFRIYTAQTSGTQVWSETHSSVLVRDGYFSVLLGSAGTPLTADKFAGATRWIEVAVDGSSLGDRQRIAAVPYALQAASVPWSGVTGKPEMGFTVITATNYLDLTTEWQDVPGLTTTFTPAQAEQVHILVLGAFNQRYAAEPALQDDPLRYRLVVNGDSKGQVTYIASGEHGSFARAYAYQVELEAGIEYTLKIQAWNDLGNRGRFSNDGQMIYWRIPQYP